MYIITLFNFTNTQSESKWKPSKCLNDVYHYVMDEKTELLRRTSFSLDHVKQVIFSSEYYDTVDTFSLLVILFFKNILIKNRKTDLIRNSLSLFNY